MILTVDTALPVPPYEQVREQIATMISSGVLSSGARLPTIRQLATDLDIAPGTITRAYRELETAGLIVSRGRHGTYVGEARPIHRAERRAALAAEAARLARIATQLGATPQETHAALDKALDQHTAIA
jgi:GntR family transcriptional regulator